jgi:hypothetical protein
VSQSQLWAVAALVAVVVSWDRSSVVDARQGEEFAASGAGRCQEAVVAEVTGVCKLPAGPFPPQRGVSVL